MINKKTTVAGRVVAVLMVFALLFAANCCVLGASAAETYGTTLYVKTTQTTTPYLYYWAEGVDPGWPGKAMTDEGGNTYSLELPCDVGALTGIIVNRDGSGDKLTGDVTNITGNLFDVDSNTWDMNDPSGIKIRNYGADNENLYVGSKTTLSMTAEGGDGNLQYKISANGTALSDWSSRTSVLWEPTAAGDYTITFEAKDGANASNSKEISLTVKDADSAVEPIFLSASPANGWQIKTGEACTVTVNGAGGQVNNKVLFYKTEVTDANGNAVNTAYYQTSNKITFTPSATGDYTVTMYIQNNTVENTTTKVSYTYSSVANPDNPDTDTSAIDSDTSTEVIVSDDDTSTEVVVSDTDTATEVEVSDNDSETDTSEDDTDTTTDVEDTNVGDFDGSGKTELRDAYGVQSGVVAKKTFTAEEIARADVNRDGEVTLKDASLIQQYMAGLAKIVDGKMVTIS